MLKWSPIGEWVPVKDATQGMTYYKIPDYTWFPIPTHKFPYDDNLPKEWNLQALFLYSVNSQLTSLKIFWIAFDSK